MKRIMQIILLSNAIVYTAFSQKNLCIDSIDTYNYTAPDLSLANISFDIPFIIDNSNNVFLQTTTIKNTGVNLGITKLDASNKVIFRKTYLQNYFTDVIDYALSYADNQNNIIVSGGALSNSSSQQAKVLKLNNSGNVLWQKFYTKGIEDENSFEKCVQGANGDIILFTQTGIAPPGYNIALLDSLGNIKWSKTYTTSLTKIQDIWNAAVTFNGTDIVFTDLIQYSMGAKEGFFVTRINYSNGLLQQTKTFQFTDIPYQVYTLGLEGYIKHFNYDPVSQKYMLVIFPDSRLWNGILEIALDENFNAIKSKVFSIFNSPFNITTLSTNNQLFSSYPNYSDTSLVYAINDENLNTIQQKKIKLSSFPVNNNTLYQSIGLFRKTGVDILIDPSTNSSNNVLNNFLLLRTSDYNKAVCPVSDTSFMTSSDINLGPLDFKLDIENPWSLTATDIPVSVEDNSLLSRTNICKQVSICDTIKITGQNNYCLDNPSAFFKLNKNPLCLRNTKWTVDTAAIKIISSNDTSLTVVFQKPYSGYLYAGFEGCDLKDSLLLHVFQKQKPVYLGKDTIFCAGKLTTLHTGNGYAYTQWQDGSSNEYFNVTQPGAYSVKVTDSCGYTSSDTIVFKDNEVQLQVDYTPVLCQYDTATITLPVAINNYTLQPQRNATLSGNVLRLFPDETTLYTVSGNVIKGCPVSDTVLVQVKNCPENAYFPNAFTPNGDGLNDFYKPVFYGHITSYQLRIYNRYGQLIFTSTNIHKGWNGSIDGHPQSTGIFVWVCSYKFIDQPATIRKGSLALIK